MILIMDFVLLALSAIWIGMGFISYGFWADSVPGSGFLPVLVGLLVFILGCVDLHGNLGKGLNRKAKERVSDEKEASVSSASQYLLDRLPRTLRPLFPVCYALLGMLVFRYIGAISCCFLVCFVWLFLVCRKTLVRSLLISVAVSGIVYGIFVAWLRIPFPHGLLL